MLLRTFSICKAYILMSLKFTSWGHGTMYKTCRCRTICVNRQRLVQIFLMTVSSTVFKVTYSTGRLAFWGCCRQTLRICFQEKWLIVGQTSSRDLQQPHQKHNILVLSWSLLFSQMIKQTKIVWLLNQLWETDFVKCTL